MDYAAIVEKMRSKNDNKDVCNAEEDLLKKCILCKYLLAPTVWSSLLENYIKEKFNIQKAVDNLSGDGCIAGKNIEIKVSLGTQDGWLNFVQLRPSHSIDYYIFLVYDLFDGEFGKYHWMLCESAKLYELIPEYGYYAHGTTVKNGKITIESINSYNFEYSLRMNTKVKTGKSHRLWLKMLQLFSKPEEEVYDMLHS